MHLQTTFELSMVLDNDKFHQVLSNVNYLEENEEGYFDQSLAAKGIIITYRDSQYKKKVKLLNMPMRHALLTSFLPFGTNNA